LAIQETKAPRIAGLDELRGIAVLIVIVAHLVVARTPEHMQWRPAFLRGGTAPATGAAPGTVHAIVDGVPVPAPKTGLVMTGYALDTAAREGSGITTVEVAIDDGPFHPATLGIPRDDLTNGYAGAVSANSGWRYEWNAEEARRGAHVMHLRVRTGSGREVRFVQPCHVRGVLPWPLGAGWWVIVAHMAVDLFFVMSGFLITGILLRAKGKPGYFANFYLRRAARILPLALICIAASYAVYPQTRACVWSHLFFYVNYAVMYRGCVMTALGQMWSLAVEEQFYIVFPLLLALFPARRLWMVIGGLVMASTALRLYGHFALWQGLYLVDGRTEVRALSILLGAWLALLAGGLVPRPRWCAALYAASIVALMVAGGRSGPLDAMGLGLAVLPVWLAVSSRAVIRNRVLAFLGVRCYGLYLVHLPIIAVLEPRLPGLPAPLFFAVTLALSIAVSMISFRFLESPLIAAAHRRRPAAVAASTLADAPTTPG